MRLWGQQAGREFAAQVVIGGAVHLHEQRGLEGCHGG
jgi:hypothetical protein